MKFTDEKQRFNNNWSSRKKIKKNCEKWAECLEAGAGTDCLPVRGERYEYACPVLSRLWLYNADGRLSQSFKNISFGLNHTFPGSKCPVCTEFVVSDATWSAFRRSQREKLLVWDASPTTDIWNSVMAFFHGRFHCRRHCSHAIRLKMENEFQERKKKSSAIDSQ